MDARTIQLAALAADLDSRVAGTRRQAAQMLAQLGVEAHDVAAALVRHAGDQDEIVAQWCVSALEDMGPPTLRQIGDLTALAKAADPNVAYWAVTLLGRAGDSAAPAVATLIERLTDASAPQVQQRAAWALGKLGPAATRAAAALESLTTVDGPVAQQAARSLAQIRAA